MNNGQNGYLRLMDCNKRITEGGTRMTGKVKATSSGKPLVTYITVVRNNVHGLKRCMESIFNQTYTNFEYIIIDGCSKDGSLNLILENADKIDYFVSEPDNSVYNAMNKAISIACGELICFMNSDDWAPPNAAEIAASLYLTNISKDCGFICGAADIFDQEGKLLFHWTPKKVHAGTLFSGMPIVHQTIYATKKVFQQIGYFDESYQIFADFKWVQTVYDNEFPILYTDQLLANYTLGGLSCDAKKGAEEACRIMKDFFPFLMDQDCYILYRNVNEHKIFSPDKPNDLVSYETLFEILNRYLQYPEFVNALCYSLAMRCIELRDKTLHWNSILKRRNRLLEEENEILHKVIQTNHLKIPVLSFKRFFKRTIFYRLAKKAYQQIHI
jgi:glycosyltransferase involved in cell wall biosynthesis